MEQLRGRCEVLALAACRTGATSCRSGSNGTLSHRPLQHQHGDWLEWKLLRAGRAAIPFAVRHACRCHWVNATQTSRQFTTHCQVSHPLNLFVWQSGNHACTHAHDMRRDKMKYTHASAVHLCTSRCRPGRSRRQRTRAPSACCRASAAPPPAAPFCSRLLCTLLCTAHLRLRSAACSCTCTKGEKPFLW